LDLFGELSVPADLSPVLCGTSGFVASKVVFPEILQAELTSFHQLQSVLRTNVSLKRLVSRKSGIAARTSMLVTDKRRDGFCMFCDDMAFERRRRGEILFAMLTVLHRISADCRSRIVGRGSARTGLKATLHREVGCSIGERVQGCVCSHVMVAGLRMYQRASSWLYVPVQLRARFGSILDRSVNAQSL
jgi:hypothetical protein